MPNRIAFSQRFALWVTTLGIALVLSACGGGGDGGLPTDPFSVCKRDPKCQIDPPPPDNITTSVTPAGATGITPLTTNTTFTFTPFASPVLFTVTVAAPTRVIAGVMYTYTASSSDGSTISWAWGDGTPDSVGNSVKKLWNKPGTYTATTSGRALITNSVVVTGAPISISPLGNHTCALKPNGTASCWGDNFASQLGDGLTTPANTPVTVPNITTAVAIAAGNGHSCAMLANGTVRCWGQGTFGQLGNNSTSDSTVTVQVSGLTDAAALSVGSANACALRAGGKVVCWGANGSGQLGDGTTTQRTQPVLVVGLTDAVSISAGPNHTCAVRAGGGVACWGFNFFGQLGNTESGVTAVTTTQTVSGLTDALSVSAGSDHTCALRASGAVVCWGGNFGGRLGNNSIDNKATPTAVMGLTDAVAISAGGQSSCALRASGDMACWGGNAKGQLGNNSTTQSLVPSAVRTLTDSASVITGNTHTCALRTTGAVSCWGDNTSGQLGIGTTGGAFSVPQDTAGGTAYWK